MTFVDELDDDDRDLPLEQDLDSDDPEDDLVACPSCGNDVYEDAEKCPHCGDWMIPHSGSRRLHWIWVLAAVAVLVSFVAVYVF